MEDNQDRLGINRRQLLQGGAAGALALTAGGLLTSSAVGASGSGSQFSPGPPQGGTPRRGGTLRVGFLSNGNAETINPLKAIANQDISRCNNLYDQLFFLNAHSVTTPCLCTEASSSHGNKLWKLKLRSGVVWHDGKPFTADDVVFTLKSSWGSKQSAFYGVASQLIDLKAVRKLDRLTVEVPLNHGVADFPSLTTLVNTWISQNGTTNFNDGIGTGPFKLESFTAGSRSVFTANKDYWESGHPYVETLVHDSSFTSDTARMNAVLSGDIDIAPQPPYALSKANAAASQIVLGNVQAPGFLGISMHIDKAPFRDVRVRQALRLLSVRSQAVTDVFDGYGTVGNDIPGSALQYFASDLHRSADPEKAKSLLKAAGQENLALTLYTSTYAPGMVETATLYAEQAAVAGVKLTPHVISPSVFYTAASPGGPYPTKLFSVNNWGLGMPSLAGLYLTIFPTGCPYAETGFGTSGHDKFLYKVCAEGNPSLAAEMWHSYQELQFNDGGYIIPSNLNFIDAYSRNVRGIATTSAGPCDNFRFSNAWLA